MRATVARAVVFCALAAGVASAASAQICNAHYPIRATGAACSGSNATAHITRPHDGVATCCLAVVDRYSPGARNFNRPSHNDRIAAGFAIAGLALGIFAELWEMFGSSDPPPTGPSERDLQREQVRGERADLRAQAARWHDAALREARKGDERSAEGFLVKAVRLAWDAKDQALIAAYERNLHVVRAQMHLKEALALKAERRNFSARQELEKAAHWARLANRKDLSDRILDYRETVPLRSDRDPKAAKTQPERGPGSTCVEVNGRLLCD